MPRYLSILGRNTPAFDTNATFTNDQYPRSKEYPESFLTTIVGRGASIGANATILPGIKIGVNAMIGAGSVVTRDVPANAIVVGNPARLQGYINGKRSRQTFSDSGENQNADLSIVDGCSTVRLKHIRDMRGDLTELSFIRDLPFEPKRVFTITGVPDRKIRGEHAHIKCHQFLVCVQGSVTAMADDGRSRQEYTLDSPALGLYMPPMIWGAQYNYTADAVLVVYASHEYEAEDYIRDHDAFVNLVEANCD